MDVVNINKNAIEYSKSISAKIKNFCQPLEDYFGINYMHYCKAYKNAKYILISNDCNHAENFISTVDYANIFYQNYFNFSSNYNCILWPHQPENLAMQTYLDYGYWNGVTFLNYTDDNSIEMFAFLSNKENTSINNIYIKNANVLEKFIQTFKVAFLDQIFTTDNCRNLAILSQGIDLYIPPKNIDNDQEKIQSFLKAIGYNQGKFELNDKLIQITSSELECLELLSQGYSVKEIAKQTLRGPRTAETLLNRIKIKTRISGYNSKSQLINLYNQKIKF